MTRGEKLLSGLPFYKMAGGGNDFVMVDNRSGLVTDGERLARTICTRRLSVGADGLILIEPASSASFRMRYFNSDGSAADFCANGTRCAARFAYLLEIAPRVMTIETGAGIVGAEIRDGEHVTLSLASPAKFEASFPLDLKTETVNGSYLRVGVPHYVVFVEEGLWERDIEVSGREMRFHARLGSEGANVNFVTVRDRHSISVRTYERGVEGETLSCGSGVVASTSVSALLDRVDSPVSVLTRSGIVLEVEFERADGGGLRNVKLTGDARVIYRSEIAGETLTGFDADWVRNPTDEGAPAPTELQPQS